MKTRKTYRSVITLAALALTVPAISGAAAPSQFEDVSVTVSYSDLNVDTMEGAKTLYVRLKRATRQACNIRSLKESGSVRNHSKARECYANALEAAVREVDSTALDTVHNS